MANQGKAKKAIKPLPHTNYPRGQQGTFVYSPDIAVYVQTDDYGVVDLSRFLTSFTLQRNVNAPSSFTCTFDNKFAKFDRVVRRMDRIVVFMKRIQWVQVFAGYISVAPWQTVVPGDAMLQAECSLKRIAYTYWDPTSPGTVALYPVAQGTSNANPDGGSAATMFRLLTVVAGWDPAQIQIQRLPDKWLAQAVKAMKVSRDDFVTDTDYQNIRDSIVRLLDADGWQGVQLKGILANSGVDFSGGATKWTNAMTGGPDGFTAIDEKWHKMVGKKGGSVPSYPSGFTTPQYLSGFIPHNKLTNSHVSSASGQTIHLRVDAAASLEALSHDNSFKNGTYSISTGYLGYGPDQRFPGQTNDQKTMIHDWMKSNANSPVVACANVKCPAGTSDHGWGIAIDFNNFSPPDDLMNRYGWLKDDTGHTATFPHHWVFVGNADQGFPAYTNIGDRPAAPDIRTGLRGGSSKSGNKVDSNQFNWSQYNRDTGQDGGVEGSSADPAFKTAFFMPSFSPTNAALGERAWINNVPLIESVASFASSSMRDFQSAPNGNFVAFFPDRLGIYGKFPAMQVRDIEMIDFKLVISDRNLITHYASVGDYSQIQDQTGIELDVIINSGTLSVEQDEVMALILGFDLKKNQNANGLGQAIMDKFGLRPKRDDNYNLFSIGYNYMNALHRFQEAWANQWQAIVSFTFLPEVFPGMRIELADKGIAVYVESITHSGSRTSGFTSTVMVSTPMRRMPNGKWALLDMEFKIKDFVDTETVTTNATGGDRIDYLDIGEH